MNYTGALYLGAGCEAFESGTVPERADQRYVLPAGLTLPGDLSVARLEDRRRLQGTIDRIRRETDETDAGGLSGFQQQAFDVLLGQRGRDAFHINREPATVRERYGHSSMGQGTLLARRLVEAGVTCVLVNYSKNNSWDTHADNFNRLKNSLLPPMDQAASALLEDLEQRGMLDDVLVLLTGEMGRTPRINNKSGRDHWTDVFSLLMAGGGLTRGQILGSSSRQARRRRRAPCTSTKSWRRSTGNSELTRTSRSRISSIAPSTSCPTANRSGSYCLCRSRHTPCAC